MASIFTENKEEMLVLKMLSFAKLITTNLPNFRVS